MYDVLGTKWHPRFHKSCTFYQNHENAIFETCTRYLVQNGIPNSTKRSLEPHFWSGAVQDEPGRPARPAWPPVPAGGPGRPAGLAGSPWASWLRSPGAPAGSGFGQRWGRRRPGRQQPRPPTPITAGGLFGIIFLDRCFHRFHGWRGVGHPHAPIKPMQTLDSL